MNNIIKRKWNQNSMVIIEDLQGMAFQAESGGHTFQISGIDGEGNTVALSGTPAGVMLRSDGQDVTLTCSVSGGVVYATLPANAYVVPGRFGLTIFLTSDGQKTAIYAAVGTVGKTSSGTVAPPAGSDVVDLVNAIAAAVATIPASYTDLMAAVAPTYSSSGLYAVGSYAWYSGKLYRCTTAITTAETWTAAHWTLANLGSDLADLKSALNGRIDRINNGTIIKNNLIDFKNIIYNSILNDITGNISGTSAPGFFTTDFMPVTAGALYYVAKASRICFYNSSKVFTEKGTRDSTSFTVPSGSNYLRISWYGVDVPLANQYVINSTESGMVDLYEMFGLTEELYKYMNLFDAFELISGNNYINSTTGAISSTTSKGYFVSKPIPIMTSHDMPIVLSTTRMFDASIPVGGRYLDSNLSALESVSLTYKNVNNNFIVSYPPIGAKYIQVTYISEPSTESTPDLFVSYGTERVDYQIVKGERYRIDIYHTNDINDFYTSMRGAFFKGNCDVYIHAGEYVYTNAFMESLKVTGVNVGVPIGNNCRYYFDTDAKIYCEYTGSDTSYMAGYFSALESKRVAGSYELHNATIIAKNILYGIHDEAQGKTDPYLHLYENCRIVLDNTNAVTKQFDHAIGGGLGANAEIILRDCYFEATSNDTRDISYHGNPNGDNCNMVITGCYFKHTLALDNPNGTDTKNLLFSNNCMNAPINYRNDFEDYGSWKVKEWNNYIRNE